MNFTLYYTQAIIFTEYSRLIIEAENNIPICDSVYYKVNFTIGAQLHLKLQKLGEQKSSLYF